MPSINRTSAAINSFLERVPQYNQHYFLKLKHLKIENDKLKVKGWVLAYRSNQILVVNTNYLPDPFWLTVQSKLWSRAVAIFQQPLRSFSTLTHPKKFWVYSQGSNPVRDIALYVIEHGFSSQILKKKYEGGVPYVLPHS